MPHRPKKESKAVEKQINYSNPSMPIVFSPHGSLGEMVQAIVNRQPQGIHMLNYETNVYNLLKHSKKV